MFSSIVYYAYEILIGIAITLSILSFFYLVMAVKAIKQMRLLKSVRCCFQCIILTPLALLFFGVFLGIRSYQVFTHEQWIADLDIHPTSTQAFNATLTFKDGQKKFFLLKGDQVQIDANILKWKPIAHFFGLNTLYSLDRISGRYLKVEDEKNNTPTLFSLKEDSSWDIAEWRKQYDILGHLVDAEYGSATFVPTQTVKTYELKISTTGLLLKEKS